jgi:photosystem II stability/assembly factor-like uncharacterized protein
MLFAAFFAAALALTWTPQISNTKAGLRGLHVVSSRVVWASGTKGTFLVTTDGGEYWRAGVVPGAESVDFRDVEAFDAQTAYLLSIGTGPASRLYLTRDGGQSWKLLFTNPDAAGFFDALAFWDSQHGIILGDPVAGHFVIFTTSDGGESWSRQQTPPALPEEGAFAASGTCLQTGGKKEAWFATGGPGAARVFHSSDAGKSWTASTTPLSGTTKSSGIFSLVFGHDGHGLAVGGDYQKPKETERTMAVTKDGGKNWSLPAMGHLGGYRSGATIMRDGAAIAVGTSGIDFSAGAGKPWNTLESPPLNAVAASSDSAIWAVGPAGVILKLSLR